MTCTPLCQPSNGRKSALLKTTSSRLVPAKFAPRKLIVVKIGSPVSGSITGSVSVIAIPLKFARSKITVPPRSTSVKLASRKSAPVAFVLKKRTDSRSAPCRLASISLALVRLAAFSLARERSARVRSAFRRTVLTISIVSDSNSACSPLRSASRKMASTKVAFSRLVDLMLALNRLA